MDMCRLSIILFTFWLANSCSMESEHLAIDLAGRPDSVEIFSPGVISTPLVERDFAISPTGDEIIFTRGDYRQNYRCLFRMVRQGKKWSALEILPFSGEFQDIEPFISPDGDLLYFSSNRPLYAESAGDYNIWVAERQGAQWVNPRALDTIINKRSDEFFPSVAFSGNLYFTASRPGGIGLEDIFISRNVEGVFQEPESLDSNINSQTYEFNAYVSPGEDLIIFSSYGREDDLGGGDLYLSKKVNGEWSPAINCMAVNSGKLDYCPFIDFTNGTFYFTSERLAGSRIIGSPNDLKDMADRPGNGLGDIYRINLSQLPL